MEFIDRREFLTRTGAAVAIGAVASQQGIAESAETPTEQAVGTLGPAGSYSHRAALQVNNQVKFHETMFAAADAVSSGEVQAAILPIENSIQGAVIDTLDILEDRDLYITAEVNVEIRHALMAQSPDFTKVASHPQALAQSSDYLSREYPNAELREVDSTSAGVELATTDSSVAAVAHPDLAEKNDLELLATDIQNVSNNVTRFIRLETKPATEGTKSTLLLYPGREAPALSSDVLDILGDADIDFTRFEARPSTKALGDYVFHADFEGGDPEAVIDTIEPAFDWVQYLGTYDLIMDCR